MSTDNDHISYPKNSLSSSKGLKCDVGKCVTRLPSGCVDYNGNSYPFFEIKKGQNLNVVLQTILDNLNPQVYTEDTATINFSGLGTLDDKLTADVNISALSGNIITEEDDGLYATYECCTLEDTMAQGNSSIYSLLIDGNQGVNSTFQGIQFSWNPNTGESTIETRTIGTALGTLNLSAFYIYAGTTIEGITEPALENSDKLASTAWVNQAISSIPSPNLQTVTDQNNVTTNAIVVKGSDNILQGEGLYMTYVSGGGSSIFSGDPSTGFVGSLVMSSSQVALHSPDASGVGKPLSIISSGTGGFISLQSETLSLNGDLTVTSANPALFNVRVKGEDAIDPNDFVTLAQLEAVPIPDLENVTDNGNTTSNALVVQGFSNLIGHGDGLYIIHQPNTGSSIYSAEPSVIDRGRLYFFDTYMGLIANQEMRFQAGDFISFDGVNPAIFNTRVKGLDAIDNDDFITKLQADTISASTITLNVGTGLSRTVGTATQTIGANPSYTLVNTAPDQTVVLNNGTGIAITGTYPNFTITNTAPFTGNFINNSTSPQVGASFNIGGSGTIGTNFTVTNGVTNITGDITFATTPSGGITFNFDGGNGTGDIFYRSSTGKLARLPIGAGVLGNSGGIPAWVPAGGTGTVTSVEITSTDITVGGTNPITTAGTMTLTLPNIVTANTFNNITFNAKGQVTGGSNVAYITASSTDVLTNKTGNISQWTNNVGYLTSFTETDPIANAKTVTLSNGTGISITGAAQTVGSNPTFTITNTAPDQTVVLNNGASISVTGTYPNFTIANTAPDQVVTITPGTGINVTGTYPNFTVVNTAPYDGLNKELTLVIDNIDLLAGGTYQILAPVGNIVLFTFGKMEIRNLVFSGVGSLVANWTMGRNATSYNDMESYTGATIQTTDPVGFATNVITSSSNRTRDITGTGVSFKITPSTNSGGFTTATGRLIYKYILLPI